MVQDSCQRQSILRWTEEFLDEVDQIRPEILLWFLSVLHKLPMLQEIEEFSLPIHPDEALVTIERAFVRRQTDRLWRGKEKKDGGHER